MIQIEINSIEKGNGSIHVLWWVLQFHYNITILCITEFQAILHDLWNKLVFSSTLQIHWKSTKICVGILQFNENPRNVWIPPFCLGFKVFFTVAQTLNRKRRITKEKPKPKRDHGMFSHSFIFHMLREEILEFNFCIDRSPLTQRYNDKSVRKYGHLHAKIFTVNFSEFWFLFWSMKL